MMRPTLRAAALAACAVITMAAAACADADADVHVRPEGAIVPAPASRGELRVESEQPLTFGLVLSAGGGTLLVSDRITNDLWLVDGSGAQLRLQRVLSGDDRLKARLVALTAHGEEWRLLDRAGRVYAFDRSTWEYRGATDVRYGSGVVTSAAAGPDGGFALLVRRLSTRSGGVAAHALVLVSADGAPKETWAWDDGGTRTGDVLSLSASRNGWIIAGSAPPRMLRFDAEGRFQGEDAFESVPARTLSAQVIAQFQRTAAAAGVASTVRPPRYYPALTSLQRVGAAYLAVPYVGGSTGEAQGLDVYCGLRYAGTLLDSPDILQVLLAEESVLVVSQLEPLTFALDMYNVADLPISCEGAQ